MDNAPSQHSMQYKCTETEQMNVQTYFPPSHGKEISLGHLGIRLLECVSFYSGKALHQRHNLFWIPSQIHRQVCQMKVSWQHAPSLHHCILMHAHIHTQCCTLLLFRTFFPSQHAVCLYS